MAANSEVQAKNRMFNQLVLGLFVGVAFIAMSVVLGVYALFGTAAFTSVENTLFMLFFCFSMLYVGVYILASIIADYVNSCIDNS